MTTYKLGTRGSLLAVTQSTLIKNEIEKISGAIVELVTIKTQGDEITNKPLWQLEGKDFFTKELDEALLKGDVDFVVHSYKDLGSVRPEGIKLAAVTERRFAHDILLISNETIKKLPTLQGEFKVGTSSPRRIANLSHSLSEYIPFAPKISCEMLRGNVNSRIKKLREGQYHAITLALAGIERLAHTEKSKQELSELLEGMNYLILPQSVFPSAASQGALGIEMNENRQDGGKLHHILSQLTHARTLEEVRREREAFKNYGGGCHLAVGIHVKKIADNFLHVHAGEIDGQRIDKRWFEMQAHPKVTGKLFVGLPNGGKSHIVYDEYLEKRPETKNLKLENKHLFVTSRYCAQTLKASTNPEGLWAAGTKSLKNLVYQGFWVNGCADSLGTEDLKSLKTSKALQIIHPHLSETWNVLSHHMATSDLGEVIGCYERIEKQVSPEYHLRLKDVGACYWTSYPQYQAFMQKFPELHQSHHFCGLGKTWQEFQKAGVRVHQVASMEEFYSLGTSYEQ